MNFHTGQPFTIFANNDDSETGEAAERANPVPGVNPFGGVSRAIQNYSVNWMNPNAYSEPALGTFGTGRRNALYGPGYSDVDLSVFKNTPITERVTAQFRVEMFNIFNRVNLAPPGDGFCTDGSSCSISTTIGVFEGAPGIGAGEPFNTQLALKLIF